ncbi:response regulator [Candidatus Saccharibacteria bacterium]|nr:response regulator [Candidatus Saccharibacteria bacterium]
MIFVIDDDEMMGDLIARACEGALPSGAQGKTPNNRGRIRFFTNAIEAMGAMSEDASELPELIFLDVLLDGPDGFTLLAEMASYKDTAEVPVVIVTSLEMSQYDLSAYGVVGVLNKDVMRPEDVRQYVKQYAS